MTKKYEPADLIRIHRAEIHGEFTRLGFPKPQVAPVTLGEEFSSVIMATYFPPDLTSNDLVILKRNVSRWLGKEIMLRDKRNKHRDKILQAAELESF